jgi:hypothetical protein
MGDGRLSQVKADLRSVLARHSAQELVSSAYGERAVKRQCVERAGLRLLGLLRGGRAQDRLAALCAARRRRRRRRGAEGARGARAARAAARQSAPGRGSFPSASRRAASAPAPLSRSRRRRARGRGSVSAVPRFRRLPSRGDRQTRRKPRDQYQRGRTVGRAAPRLSCGRGRSRRAAARGRDRPERRPEHDLGPLRRALPARRCNRRRSQSRR